MINAYSNTNETFYGLVFFFKFTSRLTSCHICFVKNSYSIFTTTYGMFKGLAASVQKSDEYSRECGRRAQKKKNLLENHKQKRPKP